MPRASTRRTRQRRVFISYRHGETTGHARAIRDHLATHLGESSVFMDVESIDPGVDFVARIDEAIKSCGILLAVIGGDWTGGGDPPRITQPGDYVRHEVEAAFANGVQVVPVLVERAPIPAMDELPLSLHPLLRTNALTVENSRWNYDIAKLRGVVTASVGRPRSRRPYLYAGAAAIVLAGAGIAVVLGLHSGPPPSPPTGSTGSTGSAFAPLALLDALTGSPGLPSSEVPSGITQSVADGPSVSKPQDLVKNDVVTDSLVDESAEENVGEVLYFVFETDAAATTFYDDGNLVPEGTTILADGVSFPDSAFPADRIHCGTYQSVDNPQEVDPACWALDGNVVLRGQTFATSATDVTLAVALTDAGGTQVAALAQQG